MGIKRGQRGISHDTASDEEITATVMHHLSFLSISIEQITPYMPDCGGCRVKYLFSVLLCIRGLNRPTKAMLITSYGFHTGSAIKAVDYLFSVGYIAEIGRPRLIIPFQRFKVDKGYVITAKGEAVLRKIICK